MVGATTQIFVVVDGHPIHKAKLVKAFVETQNRNFKSFYLPPYSPHLNPEKQVWRMSRAGATQLGNPRTT